MTRVGTVRAKRRARWQVTVRVEVRPEEQGLEKVLEVQKLKGCFFPVFATIKTHLNHSVPAESIFDL